MQLDSMAMHLVKDQNEQGIGMAAGLACLQLSGRACSLSISQLCMQPLRSCHLGPRSKACPCRLHAEIVKLLHESICMAWLISNAEDIRSMKQTQALLAPP